MNRTGIVQALLSLCLFGASTPLGKLLLGVVNPWMMAGLLYLRAGLSLAVVHASRAALRIPAADDAVLHGQMMDLPAWSRCLAPRRVISVRTSSSPWASRPCSWSRP